MKSTLLALPLLFCLISCSPNSKVKTADSPELADNMKDTSATKDPLPDEMCFRAVQGRDTSTIKLYISVDEVHGSYNWKPFEKDARMGTLNGTIQAAGTEKVLKATWAYRQEGMKQELPFEAMISPNALRQKEYRLDTTTGQEVPEPGDTYSKSYQRVDCAEMPQQ